MDSPPAIIGQAFGVILGSVLGRFFFQWMYDRTMSGPAMTFSGTTVWRLGTAGSRRPWDISQNKIWALIQAMLTTTIADLEGYPCWRLSR